MSISRLICTGCGAEANASCNCGLEYKPKSARAAEAVEANPEKSNRALSAETGIGKDTIRKARDQLATSSQLKDGPRTGLDGKTRRLPQREEHEDLGTDGLVAERAAFWKEHGLRLWIAHHPGHTAEEFERWGSCAATPAEENEWARWHTDVWSLYILEHGSDADLASLLWDAANHANHYAKDFRRRMRKGTLSPDDLKDLSRITSEAADAWSSITNEILSIAPD
jgi:hypothetical protein